MQLGGCLEGAQTDVNDALAPVLHLNEKSDDDGSALFVVLVNGYLNPLYTGNP